MKWSSIKKRLISKTYLAANMMLALGVTVELHSPEIKQIVSEKLGVEWGIVYAVGFTVVMSILREVTKEPISQKGEKE